MIYQLLVYAGGDGFSYEMSLNKQVSRNDYEGLLPYVNQWTDSFKAKHCTCLHLLILKLDPINGVTGVVKNDFYKHPLKQRVEINKKAQEALSQVKAKKGPSVMDLLAEIDQAQAAQAQMPQPVPAQWVVNPNNPQF